ncbi:MAG: peptide chain release factor 1 [Alphaproteobacteria bacterium]
MILQKKLDELLKRFYELEEKLSSPLSSKDLKISSKELAEISPIADIILEMKEIEKEQEELKELLKTEDLDNDLKELSTQELKGLKVKINELEEKIYILLLPKDADDERSAILEIRAGTGGEEAGLFGFNLLRMYQRYSSFKGWRFELLNTHETEIGAIKEASALIKGKGVFARLKFESGVHRVQRVPKTETGGRIHTSTATIAVLPEVEDIDIHIDEKDLQIDVYRASGAGGQHVNTTDSAVRVTHIPTGIVVTQQDDRSQHKNKAKAMKILRARLYELEKMKQQSARSQSRKEQVGTGERCERIRTYNFQQGRVSDHRINLTLYKISEIMEGGEALDEIIDALISQNQMYLLSKQSLERD